ncbi:GIY-YIG nuclease family protein [uncultured Nitrospira sp.]|uniref:GIY-YIG nuclease family protein n=1 Tax=uncultured Nitrospira sp. TaxID=157176 RepID=UPI00314015FF
MAPDLTHSEATVLKAHYPPVFRPPRHLDLPCHFAPLSFRPEGEILSMAHAYYVYLLTNWNNTVMYVGMTNDLKRRMYEHKKKLVKGFTQKYNINKLVYVEETQDVNAAILREKEIKKWRREKKDSLVMSENPQWKDLSLEFQDSSLRSE